MKSRKRSRRVKAAVAILLALLVLAGVECVLSNTWLRLTPYSVSSEKLSSPIRVVFLSDLHGKEFGEGNQRLLKLIAEQKPDLIALGGDLFNNNADAREIDTVCGFIREAAKLAPTYFCMGNHEAVYNQKHGSELRDRVREAGAVVLDTEFLDVEIKGNALRIGGYMGYYRQPGMMSAGEAIQKEFDFADEFENTERFKLLLDHIPTGWIDWNYKNKYPVDLVLCGHYHGGVVRVPLLEQGLYAPYVGWFPPYTKGLFEGTQATCVLTTGLAGFKSVPRFFNRPEICVVDLVPG